MSFVCLRIPASPTGAAANDRSGHVARDSGTGFPTTLLEITPHVVVATPEQLWLDARGLDGGEVARRAVAIARQHGIAAPSAGVAATAVAAAVAARQPAAVPVVVPRGADAAFLAPFPLDVLDLSPPLAAALAGVGLESCGDLARLSHEAVEIRFGAEGVALWRLARADDRRWIFLPAPRPLPSASLAWEEYLLRDAGQILFVANRLVTTVCEELQRWGEAARALRLEFILAGRATVTTPLRVARESANRAVWMRLIRRELDRLRLADGVAGLTITVEAAGAAGSRQGDLFDRGFQTAQAVVDALGRLEDDGHAALVTPVISAHPLPEHRLRWQVREPVEWLRDPVPTRSGTTTPRLVLQLLPEPSPAEVTHNRCGGRDYPVRLRAAGWPDTGLLTTAGPDRVSAGAETGAPYAREYFTALTREGRLVLFFRDALTDRWYLHGWWD